MTPTELILTIAATWTAVALASGLTIGAVIRTADQRQAQQ